MLGAEEIPYSIQKIEGYANGTLHCPAAGKSAGCVGIGLLLLIVVFQRGLQTIDNRRRVQRCEKVTVTKNGEGTEVAFKGINGEDVRFAGGKRPSHLPAEFPADVAVYPQATPVMTVTTVDKEMTRHPHHDRLLAEGRGFLQGQDEGERLEEQTTTDMPQMSMLEAEKEGRKLVVLISETPKEPSIQPHRVEARDSSSRGRRRIPYPLCGQFLAMTMPSLEADYRRCLLCC